MLERSELSVSVWTSDLKTQSCLMFGDGPDQDQDVLFNTFYWASKRFRFSVHLVVRWFWTAFITADLYIEVHYKQWLWHRPQLCINQFSRRVASSFTRSMNDPALCFSAGFLWGSDPYLRSVIPERYWCQCARSDAKLVHLSAAPALLDDDGYLSPVNMKPEYSARKHV